MKCDEVCEFITKIGIIPAIRVSSAEDAHFAVEAVTAGGIPMVEITMTVPEAVALISHVRNQHKKVLVGAGTVLDIDTAKRCLDAGAHFITAPGFDARIVDFCLKENVAVLPGALTPTEVVAAWSSGAHFVKVFPCGGIGGDKYIKALKVPLPQVPIIAAGGVNQQTAASYILAGAVAIGVGAELIPADAVENRELDRIKELARRFTFFVKDARSKLIPPPAIAASTKSSSTSAPSNAAPTDFSKLDKHPKP